jgi:2-C-methyl-D-erythritol 4-phosphate cytidylyltransferase
MIVKGGITRFHSVKNALAKVPDGAIVAIHDAVRPLASVRLVQELVAKAAECGSAIPVIPAIDTLRVLDNCNGELHSTSETIDRTKIYSVQTPQVFYSEILSKAYTQAFDTAFTDDASVVEKNKIPLSYVIGERFNIKITTAEDLFLAQAIIQKKD